MEYKYRAVRMTIMIVPYERYNHTVHVTTEKTTAYRRKRILNDIWYIYVWVLWSNLKREWIYAIFIMKYAPRVKQKLHKNKTHTLCVEGIKWKEESPVTSHNDGMVRKREKEWKHAWSLSCFYGENGRLTGLHFSFLFVAPCPFPLASWLKLLFFLFLVMPGWLVS